MKKYDIHLIKLYKEGVSLAELKRRFKVSHEKLKSYLISNGVELISDTERKIRYGAHSHTHQNISTHIELIEFHINEGYSLQESLNLLDINLDYNIVYSHIKKRGKVNIDVSNNGKSKTSVKHLTTEKFKISDIEKERIVKLYHEEGKTLKEIGVIYNTTAATVLYFCRRHNIKRRSKSEIMITRNLDPKYKNKLVEYGHMSYAKRRMKRTCYEESFALFLENNHIKYEEQWRKVGNKHPYDFLLTEYNLLVEIDGAYWHSTEKQIARDTKQMNEAILKGYNIIRINSNQLKTDSYANIINKTLGEIYDRSYNFI